MYFLLIITIICFSDLTEKKFLLLLPDAAIVRISLMIYFNIVIKTSISMVRYYNELIKQLHKYVKLWHGNFLILCTLSSLLKLKK